MKTKAGHAIDPPRLLVVDADEAVRLALKRLLERVGCEVRLAWDSHTGADLLASGPIDLVIMDLDTFAKDGQTLCEQLCRPDALYPILVLSRAADASDREEAVQVGGLLVKPVDAKVLLQTVEILLQRSPGTWPALRLETRVLALRRLQARGARFLRCNLPYRSLYH